MALPLEHVRVVEMAGLAPVPYCGMILADFGADVIRIDRLNPGFLPSRPDDPLGRGKKSIRLDLKKPRAAEIALQLLEKADVLLDPYRPGVMERWGLGPEVVQQKNPRLVYARLTGYGQDGPYAAMAGHDINYVALSGALSLCGRAGQPPAPPANLLADFAGGGMLCALGVMMALFERERSGQGQVIDSAMIDGAAHLTTAIHYLRHVGIWQEGHGKNWFDTGAPWYDVYETSDGKYVSVGALEPQFFAAFVAGLGLDPSALGHPMDAAAWPVMREALAQRFRQKTRDEWCAVFDGTDACVAPVLGLGEVADHPHNRARAMVFTSSKGVPQPAPAPRLSRTPAHASMDAPADGEHTREVLRGLGVGDEEIQQLEAQRVIRGAD